MEDPGATDKRDVVVADDNPFGALTTEPEAFRNKLYQLVFVDGSSGLNVSNAAIRDQLLASTGVPSQQWRRVGSR